MLKLQLRFMYVVILFVERYLLYGPEGVRQNSESLKRQVSLLGDQLIKKLDE